MPGRFAHAVAETWRGLHADQRVAGIGAVLLIVSTFGPFSFVEGAIVLIGLSILLLLRRRAQGRDFQLPFGDGAMIAAAGVWSALLIVVRLFSRPLGQGLLALVCAAILIAAGLRERAREAHAGRPAPPPRSDRRARRHRDRTAARNLFGSEPPRWEGDDPAANEPPTWKPTEPPSWKAAEPPTVETATDTLFDPDEPPSIPPATRAEDA